MLSPVLAAVLAFVGGAAVSWLNYRINLRTLKTKPSALGSVSAVRQILSIAWLVIVYLVSGALGLDRMYPLLGAAFGLTIPSILLALRLAKINDSLRKGGATASGKGDDTNG